MSGFPIIDLVFGIIFVYFLLSIISSSGVEMILTGLRARATVLEDWLFKIFDKIIEQPDGSSVSLGQAIMDHCSVTALSGNRKSTSYIDAKNFTSVLIEKITFDPAKPNRVAKDIDELIRALENTTLLSTEFQRVLLIYANEAKDSYLALTKKTESEIEIFRSKVENWFDSSMERITGTLKKKYSRPATLVVATIVTFFLNADSISLSKYLYSNPEARTRIAMQAYNVGTDSDFIRQVQQIKIANTDTSSINGLSAQEIKNKMIQRVSDINKAKLGLNDVMPLTWKQGELNDGNGHFSALLLFSKITGLLATILAIMLGAPFWFDVLNKVSNLRSTGAKPVLSAVDDKKKN
jgi:hypothetical protein